MARAFAIKVRAATICRFSTILPSTTATPRALARVKGKGVASRWSPHGSPTPVYARTTAQNRQLCQNACRRAAESIVQCGPHVTLTDNCRLKRSLTASHPAGRQRPERQQMDRNFFALSLGLAGLILLPGLGHAQDNQCGPHDAVAAALSSKFGEQSHAMGLAEDNTVMELYAAPQTGTWTLTVTLPNGMTCLVAAGNNFETLSPQVARGAPT